MSDIDERLRARSESWQRPIDKLPTSLQLLDGAITNLQNSSYVHIPGCTEEAEKKIAKVYWTAVKDEIASRQNTDTPVAPMYIEAFRLSNARLREIDPNLAAALTL